MSDMQKDLAEVERPIFEAWIQTTSGWKACKQRGKPMHLRQNSDGSYNDLRVNDRWFSWLGAVIQQNAEELADWEEFGRRIEKRLRMLGVLRY